MTDHPTTPTTDQAAEQADTEARPAPRRTLRDRLPSGRRAVAAGAVVAGLAIGGAGFGAGYAVADHGSSDTATTQTTGEWGDRQMPGGPGQPGGQMGGQIPGAPMGEQPGGTTGQPDFDGDGQPDTDSGTTDSSTQNS